MGRTMITAALALLAGALWMLWAFAHEHTSIRAPWTGLTYALSVTTFVVVGVVGRGWRALACSASAGVAAALLVDPLISRSEPLASDAAASCDPGCISTGAFVVMAAAASAALACVGILLRRVVLGRRGAHRAPV
ncbi:MAG TPA: hypothetical protein VHF89_13400 [Solirubrobacteraceae bacterium]|nr:hypothetical protein [Solirubrobacteraceae bacterium]